MVYTDGILRPRIGDRVPPSMPFTPNTAPEFHDPERAALIAELYVSILLGNWVMEGIPEAQAFLWLGDAGCLRALV